MDINKSTIVLLSPKLACVIFLQLTESEAEQLKQIREELKAPGGGSKTEREHLLECSLEDQLRCR